MNNVLYSGTFLQIMQFFLGKFQQQTNPRYSSFPLIRFCGRQRQMITYQISLNLLLCDSFAWLGCVIPNNHFLLRVECSRKMLWYVSTKNNHLFIGGSQAEKNAKLWLLLWI